MSKLFTVILTCEKYKSKMLQQDTSRLGDHMYFIGDPSLSDPIVKGRVVYLPCKDNYESLTDKSLMAIKWAVENREFDLLLKTDDDVVFLGGFDQMVLEAAKHDYCGFLARGGYSSSWHFGKCEDKELGSRRVYVPSVVYCRGGGYFLSRRSVLLLAKQELRPDRCIFEDAEVGELLRRGQITANRIEIKDGMKWPE
jgi:chondroitin synthase